MKNITILIFSLFSSIVFAEEPVKKIHFAVVPSFQNYDLSGGGFAVASKNQVGQGLDFSYEDDQDPDVGWKIRLSSNKQEITTPSGLSPSKVNSELQRALLGYQLEHQNYKLFLGFEYRNRTAGSTTPSQVLPTTSRLGPHVAAKKTVNYSENLDMEYGLGLFLPFYVQESKPLTGSYKYSLAPEGSFNLVHRLNKNVLVSIGLEVLLETTVYAGLGERGTRDATEQFLTFNLPVAVKYEFY